MEVWIKQSLNHFSMMCLINLTKGVLTMVTMNEVLKNAENQAEVNLLRDKFLKSRAEYELSLRKLILNKVKNCPCCFKRLLNISKDYIKQQDFEGDFDPDELAVLEEMLFRVSEKNEEVNNHEIH